MKNIIRLLAVFFFLVIGLHAHAKPAHTFEVGNKTFLLDGEPFVIKAAEVHYTRIPRPYWEHRIKMCKALGMNTLCIYIFWNAHEQREGEFDFTGNHDVAEFVRLAQKHDMWVIVRPGPYVCAEWEMGGLPWWLLKKQDIRLRELDPYFMESVERFQAQVAQQLLPLTIANGGPIIMVQVENEYGSYGEDKPYVSAIRDCLRRVGFDQTVLFQCDWASNFTKNGLDDLVWTMNFGTGANVLGQFKRLQELRPESPLMCSEYWSGWFDGWGRGHETRSAKAMVNGLRTMLENNISFSLYMTHGGTSFGQWAGANSPGYKPDCTSYDYDAPISESGRATEKYYELREMLATFNDGKKLPSVPKPIPTIEIPEMTFTQMAPLFDNLPSSQVSEQIRTMETFDQGFGSMLYTCQLPATKTSSSLHVTEVHDFAMVYIDGKYMGKLYRGDNQHSLKLPPLPNGGKLELFVEAMGRINFGRAIKDPKGITEKVELITIHDGHEVTYNLKNWQVALFPFSYEFVKSMPYQTLDPSTLTVTPSATRTPVPATVREKVGYYRTTFRLKKTGDTFLDVSSWGKGIVWVNGYCLGRFWRIGPQQTLYLPGCWLKKGENEIIVMDILGPEAAVMKGVTTPVVDQLRLERPATHRAKGETLSLEGHQPIAEGAFAMGNGWQEVKLAKPAKGQYLCIEAIDNHHNDEYAAIAELYAVGTDGKRLSREPWLVYYADSEENRSSNSTADKVFDLQESTYWTTTRKTPFPHSIVIDLGSVQTISAVQYLPRMEEKVPGAIRNYRIYLSEKPFKK